MKVGTTYLSIGTNPAAADTIRLPNNSSITARNAANSADKSLIYLNASDLVVIDANSAGVSIPSTLRIGTTPATTGALRLPNDNYIGWRNAGNSADVAGLRLGTDDVMRLYDSRQTGAALIRTKLADGSGHVAASDPVWVAI